MWLDRMLFLSDTQASKLKAAAAGWEAAEVGKTQLQKYQGGWTVKGAPALKVVPQERVCPIESKGQRSKVIGFHYLTFTLELALLELSGACSV